MRAERVRELAMAKGRTVDGLRNELMNSSLRSVWLKLDLYGAKVKTDNMPTHMANMHPKAI
jgi:hypothetical protein